MIEHVRPSGQGICRGEAFGGDEPSLGVVTTPNASPLRTQNRPDQIEEDTGFWAEARRLCVRQCMEAN
jgi:hypothetical protein